MATQLANGGALLTVLLLLAIASTSFAEYSLQKQQAYLASARQVERFEMQKALESVLNEVAIQAEQGHVQPDVPDLEAGWSVTAITTPVSCPSEPPPESQVHCLRIEATIESESGLVVHRSRRLWANTNCGAIWQGNL